MKGNVKLFFFLRERVAFIEKMNEYKGKQNTKPAKIPLHKGEPTK